MTRIARPVPSLWPVLRYNLDTLSPHVASDVKSRVVPVTVQVRVNSYISISYCLDHSNEFTSKKPSNVQEFIDRVFNPGIRFYLRNFHVRAESHFWNHNPDVYIAAAHNRTGGVFQWAIKNGHQTLAEGNGTEMSAFLYTMGLAATTAAIAISAAIKWLNKKSKITHITIHSQVPAIISRLQAMIWSMDKSMPNKRIKLEWDLEYAITASSKLGKIKLLTKLFPKPKKKEMGSSQWQHFLALQLLVRERLKKSKERRQAPVECGEFLTHKGTQITLHEGARMREIYQIDLIKKKLISRYNMTNQEWEAIDWDGFWAAYSTLSQNQQWQLTKFWFGWLPVGHQMSRRDGKSTGICPTCGKTHETCDHIIKCIGSGRSRKSVWTRWRDGLCEILQKTGTKPDIIQEIIQSSDNWSRNVTSRVSSM